MSDTQRLDDALAPLIRQAQGGAQTVMRVELWLGDNARVLETSVRVTAGKTFVLGNAQQLPGRGTLILAVRLELVRPG